MNGGAPFSRARIAAAVEVLIAALDAMETDADREPSLGWTLAGALGDRLDLEAENDDEPSLGWTTAINQTPRQRYHGGGDDLEHEHDGREEDDPPEDCSA